MANIIKKAKKTAKDTKRSLGYESNEETRNNQPTQKMNNLADDGHGNIIQTGTITESVYQPFVPPVSNRQQFVELPDPMVPAPGQGQPQPQGSSDEYFDRVTVNIAAGGIFNYFEEGAIKGGNNYFGDSNSKTGEKTDNAQTGTQPPAVQNAAGAAAANPAPAAPANPASQPQKPAAPAAKTAAKVVPNPTDNIGTANHYKFGLWDWHSLHNPIFIGNRTLIDDADKLTKEYSIVKYVRQTNGLFAIRQLNDPSVEKALAEACLNDGFKIITWEDGQHRLFQKQ